MFSGTLQGTDRSARVPLKKLTQEKNPYTLFLQCNKAREHNFSKSLFWAKNCADMSTCNQMLTTTVFIAIYRTSFSPYIANREAIHVRGTFHAFFTFFG